MTAIAILGEHTPASAPQAATAVAIGHAQARLGVAVEAQCISTAAIDARPLVSAFVEAAVACTKVRHA